MDEKLALRLTSSMGGGVGRLREICGAVSGAALVLGVLYGSEDPCNAAEKAAHYARIQEVAEKFRAEAGAIVCRELLKLQEEPFMILALVGKELRRLHTARIALDEGRDKFWLMERWNMRSDYPAKLLLENAERVSRKWCADAVRRCCEVDLRIKSVSGVDGADELKLLLMELAQGVKG